MKRLNLRLLVGATLLLAAQAAAAQTTRAETGEALFQQRCSFCHSLTPSKGKMGPPLRGVVGRRAGASPGYAYSDAIKSSGRTWSPKELDSFLAAPAQRMSGTRMMVAVPNAEERAAIIKFLAAHPQSDS